MNWIRKELQRLDDEITDLYQILFEAEDRFDIEPTDLMALENQLDFLLKCKSDLINDYFMED